MRINNAYLEMWIEDGIIYNSFKPNLVIDLEIAKKMVEERLKVSDGIGRPMFTDINNLISIDLDAREYLASKDSIKYISAGAIFCTNPIAKFLGRLFLFINRPQITTKIFSNKDEAIKWLQQFKA